MKNFSSFIALLFLSALLFSCKEASIKNAPVLASAGAFAHPSVASVTKEITANPDNAALYFKRGKALRALEEDSIALLDYKKAVQLDSSKAIYFSSIGELLFEHKDLEGSVIWFKKAIAIDPKDAVSHLKFAKMLLYVNDNQKAFNEINVVLRQDPYNAEAYYLKGLVYKTMSDTARAISSFQTSVQVDPVYQPSIMQLALIFAGRKDSIALNYFDNAYRADSSDLMSLYGKGMFYQENGKPEQAKAVYKKCILRDPQYGDAYFNTGWILMHQDSMEKAARQFDFVTKIEPGNAEAYYNKGVCYEIMKNTAAALANYKQALEFSSDYKEAKDGIQRLSK